jgi:hypothetical protein
LITDFHISPFLRLQDRPPSSFRRQSFQRFAQLYFPALFLFTLFISSRRRLMPQASLSSFSQAFLIAFASDSCIFFFRYFLRDTILQLFSFFDFFAAAAEFLRRISFIYFRAVKYEDAARPRPPVDY